MAKILVADDSRTLRTLVKRTLLSAGHEVVMATDGQEAVDCVREERPELLILDIEMPCMDGYAVCQELQAMGEPWAHIPIIFLTKVQAQALNVLAAQLGAYLSKPFESDSLLSTVAKLVPPVEQPDCVSCN